ncbi:hypothetical protein [Streptomyces sp. NPDC060194]|uniref:hypothetical protein n=1 Tax=Streptomyces sp. NPDC060194 TaxID=3347069 RepID=UPI0036665029
MPDQNPAPAASPPAEEAYALAPSITREIAWVAFTARDFGHVANPREYWLRKAAVFDRIALAEANRHFVVAGTAAPDADATADDTARRLVQHDQVTADGDPRDYVRREYARWITTQ